MSPPRALIGLEVHVYLRTAGKLFCACSAAAHAAPGPNAHVCPTCTGQPGAKPMAPNVEAFAAGIRVARALGATLQPRVEILRKHYFYPDLPANFQRTGEPLATGGSLLGVPLTQMHVEEDPGQYDPASGLVDYNRSGVPLLEIVTEPALASPARARAFLDELRLVLDYLGVRRPEAGLKADCNLSLEGGARTEVKNVGSHANVERALAHELARHLEARASGHRVARETRHFDEATGRTTRLREKETEADYRFLPEPDLLAVDVAALAARIPPEEPPLARRARLAALAGVPEAEAWPLVEERALADAFEVLAARAGPGAAREFVVRDLRGELAARHLPFAEARLPLEPLARLVEAKAEGRLSDMVAKRLLRAVLEGADLAGLLADELAKGQHGGDALLHAVRAVLDANPRAVDDYRRGKAGALNFLHGQVMRHLQGRADPRVLRGVLENALRAGPTG